MASNVINALFTARETISKALQSASGSVDNFERNLDELNVSMTQAGLASEGAEKEFDSFANGIQELRRNASGLDDSLDEVTKALAVMTSGSSASESEMDDFVRAMRQANISAEGTEQSIDSLQRGLVALASSGSLTGEQLGRLQTKLTNVSASSGTGSSAIQTMNRSMFALLGAAKSADDSVDDLSGGISKFGAAAGAASVPTRFLANSLDKSSDEMEEASRSAQTLSANLGVLSTIAGASAFEFSSLSVNIGPFNLALRNILTQLPTILTGMSTMLAIVSSLVGAFITLGAVTGALVLGGALAFFEDFSQQFEESAEAVEALMGALKDLFIDALAPVMNEANMDLFVDTINMAARAVNEFAQFASQMRGEVMSFLGGIDGSLDATFEAMHDSFVMMAPILASFIEFFINDFPKIMVRFAALTDRISGDISTLMKAFGGLISQLLDFASVILSGAAPVIVLVVDFLIALFTILNSLPDVITATAVSFLGLSLVVLKLVTTLSGLASALVRTNAQMAAQAGTGSFLGVVYRNLTGAALTYTSTNMTLLGAIKAATAGIWSQIVAIKTDGIEKLRTSLITAVLTKATTNFVRAIKTSTAWTWLEIAAMQAARAVKLGLVAIVGLLTGTLTAEAAASMLASAAMWAYSAAASVAAAATSVLAGAVGLLTLPISATALAVAGLVAIFLVLVDIFTGGAISGAISDFFGGIISFIKDTIDALLELIGLGGDGVLGGVGGVADTDDIQTNPNVDLSFEDSLEQNVDVQADPEDQEGLRRIVKDAMNEANSISRRQQGAGR